MSALSLFSSAPNSLQHRLPLRRFPLRNPLLGDEQDVGRPGLDCVVNTRVFGLAPSLTGFQQATHLFSASVPSFVK